MTPKEEKFIDAVERGKNLLKGAERKSYLEMKADCSFVAKLLGEAVGEFCYRPSAEELYDDPSEEKDRIEMLED